MHNWQLHSDEKEKIHVQAKRDATEEARLIAAVKEKSGYIG